MRPLVSVTCPSCRARLRAQSPRRPRTGECPRCRHPVSVPAGTLDGGRVPETSELGTRVHEGLSAEARSLASLVRARSSEAGRRWAAVRCSGAAGAERARVVEAVRNLRVVHAACGRGRLDRGRARALAARIPPEAMREMAELARSPAGEWAPPVEGGDAGITLREAFDRFRRAVSRQADTAPASPLPH